jgi:hypothetical protein
MICRQTGSNFRGLTWNTKHEFEGGRRTWNHVDPAMPSGSRRAGRAHGAGGVEDNKFQAGIKGRLVPDVSDCPYDVEVAPWRVILLLDSDEQFRRSAWLRR